MRAKCQRCTSPAVRSGLCARHLATPTYVAPRQREPRKRTSRRYEHPLRNDERWQEISRWWLARHPWCARCQVRPLVAGGALRRVASQVDHIIPVRAAPDRKYAKDNLQSLCAGCHSRKGSHEARGVCHDYLRGVAYRL